MARIGLFGNFSIDGDREPVRGAIPQAILARLALEAGGALTTEQLVADLWWDAPPTVVSSLRAHISRLRSRGWGDLLSSGRSGYRMAIDPDDVDVLRFERLVDDDAEPRVRALGDAERLWTGAPLASLREFPFSRAVVDRLTRRRRECVVELAELRMRGGENALVVATIAAYLSENPADTEMIALQARALSRAGRLTEAVETIDAFPAADGAQLSALRAAIVRQDPVVLGTAGASAPERVVDRTGIPIPLTRFIGREGELETVRLSRAQSRLVTLTGAAGVGKTRLAIEAARRAGPDEDDVQRLIDLAAVSAPDAVLGVVADAVGAADHSLDAIARVLGGRRALLLLDNAEHVLGATASLAAGLLERCEGLCILVTSREAMRMAGERVVVVDPLVGAAAGDAVTLFLQRASDARGVEDWSDDDLTRVGELCRTLDGLPLAIELAAARLDVLSIDELAESLHAPAQSTGGRHDSIDDAIAWSMRLASPSERAMLSQLVEFSGTFTLDAVAGVCLAEEADPRELTASLARRSLVAVIAADSGERRFRVLEAVRRHVRARIPMADAEGWQRRHAEFLTTLAERQVAALRSAEVRRVKAILSAWRADFDDALSRLIEWGDRAGAERLVAALAWYWYERGLGADAVAAIERALALDGVGDPDREAAALHAAAFLRAVGTEPLETVRMTHRFAAAADAARDPHWPAIAQAMMAYLAAGAGDADRADQHLAAAAEHAGRIGDAAAWARADELMIRGDALRALGRPAQALDVLAEAFRLATELHHTWAVKGSCFVTGKVLTEVGRPRDAIAILRTGAIRSLDSGDVTSAFAAIGVSAAAFVRLDRAQDAAMILGALDTTGARFGYHPEGSDGEFTAQTRGTARAALASDEWEAAYARGTLMDLRQTMQFLADFR